MNKKSVNRCLYCDCYDEDFGCTMPSMDKWYACPLETNDEKLERLFNMNDDLIRKSDVLELIDSLNISDRQIYEDLIFNVEDMLPVKAVELPCKVGDKAYFVCDNKSIIEFLIKDIHIYKNYVGLSLANSYNQYLTLKTTAIGKKLFFTRTEAENTLKTI